MQKEIRFRKFYKLLKKQNRIEKTIRKKYGPEPEFIGKEMDQVCFLQEKILKLFDLTPTAENVKLLFDATNVIASSKFVYTIYSVLKEKGQNEKEENVAPLELLATSILQAKEALDVLERIGFSNHVYQVYLYDLIKENPSDIISIYNEMVRAQPFLGEIAQLKELFTQMTDKNINFIRAFLDR